MDEHLPINRAMWDERAPAHAASPDHGFQRFASDPAHLSGTVRFDLPRLGDIRGMRGVHLQCHIGTDTVSLARLGAHMTGLDFSALALVEARRLATMSSADVEFIESELYAAPEVLPNEAFDLVYTGIGALCWLPDIRRWAGVVAKLLKPGGRLFMREGHPMLWTLGDPRPDGLLAVEYPWFESAGPSLAAAPQLHTPGDPRTLRPRPRAVVGRHVLHSGVHPGRMAVLRRPTRRPAMHPVCITGSFRGRSGPRSHA